MAKKELKLTVAEARRQADVGRGLVRLDEGVMKKLGIKQGDIVEIKGTRLTGAIAVKGYPEDRGLNVARMDGLIRRNAGTSIGEKVDVSKAEIKEAKKVTVAPAEPGIRIMASGVAIKRSLLGRPLVKGDVITPTALGETIPFGEDIFERMFGMLGAFGLGEIKFTVVDTNPTGMVLVTDLTEVKALPQAVEVPEVKAPAVTYEDIGGLKDEIQRVREMIELPLKHPELFDRLGIEPPKGVLLHGPPGTGKTLIAKAVANESDAYFVSLAGPEVMSKFYGESEARLREIFKEAEKNAPAILFIDELDAIAPKREEVTGEVERRVVAQLCTMMDGLKARGKVIVIGATNRPHALDPAIRRPGRFDREIVIGVPDRDGRKEILQIHTRGMPLAKDVDLDALANITHGFVGADLEALCKEAAMSSLRRILPEVKLEEKVIPPEVLEKLRVTKEDFDEGLKMVEPSAMREVLIEVPDVRWEDIGGLKEAKQELREAVEWPLKHPEAFKRMGIQPPRGILLYGPPGTGKTLLARAVATESEANFIAVKGPEMLCISGEVPIFTDFCGVIPIKELYENLKSTEKTEFLNIHMGVKKLKIPIHTFGVDDNGKIVKTLIERIYKLYVPKAYKLKFSDGNEITVSANQPFLAMQDNKIQWVKTESLHVNDSIAVPAVIGSFDKKVELEFPKYMHLRLVSDDEDNRYVKIFSTKTITKLPKRLTPELAEFLGWFVAEGNVSKKWVAICNADPKNQKRISELFRIFVPKKRIAKRPSKITVYSTPLVVFLESLFEMPLRKKSYRIKVPSILFKGPKELIGSFLKGAYSGDGHIDDKKIEYGTMSRKLAEGIVYLLTILGIKCKYWRRKDGLYLITISGKLEMQKFKQAVYGGCDGENVRRYYNARYVIPDISDVIRIAKTRLDLHYGREIPEGLFEGIINKRKRCGRIRLKRMFEYLDKYATPKFKSSEIYRTLKILAEGELRWVRIVAKEPAEPQWMYDVETENSSFIGGNLPLILHNSKWVGESERAVRETFRKARMAAPSIIFFDEIDAVVPRRGSGIGDAHVTERVISQLLTELDGLEKLENVVVMAATNRPDLIDPALLRAGRFDRLVLVPAPDKKARLEIFKIHTKGMPLAKDVNLETLATEAEGYAGSDIEAICREAAMLVLRKDIKGKEVSMKHFRDAMKKIKPTITPEIEKSYETFGERYGKRLAEEVTRMHY